MKNVLIIIPVYNEEENLEYVINDLKTYKKENMDLLFIDDGSTDASYKIILKYNLYCLKNEKNIGNYKTIKKGVNYAYEEGYQYVILFDADRQHKAKEIESVYDAIIKNNADFVIGSRYFRNNNVQEGFWKKLRKKNMYKYYSKGI